MKLFKINYKIGKQEFEVVKLLNSISECRNGIPFNAIITEWVEV